MRHDDEPLQGARRLSVVQGAPTRRVLGGFAAALLRQEGFDCTFDGRALSFGSHTRKITDADARAFEVGDPIAGTFTIHQYDPQNGKLDVAFDGVVLQSTNSTALCTVNRTLTSQHLYP